MGRTHTWPRGSLHQEVYFRHFFARVSYVRTGRCLIQPAATATLSSQNLTIYAILQKQRQTDRVLGEVLDSSAQRGATGRKSEILKHTGTHAASRGPCKTHDWHSHGC